ncbi:Fur-regulated basic protein FbpA [Bacillus wiedmannii]|nr:Fur-regulated basic protein FbpA [Bacillus wiedmannii]PEF36878.1 Fur-regulated basic protein FbpA [Bacillus wiedmannii]
MNKQHLIERLLKQNVFKLIDGRNLYEATCKELELLFKKEAKQL